MKSIYVSAFFLVFSANTEAAGLWDSIQDGAKDLGGKAREVLNKNKEEKPANEKNEPVMQSTPPQAVEGELQRADAPKQPETKGVKSPDPTSSDVRGESKYGFNVTLAPMSAPFPMAWGVNGYYVASQRWMFMLDYQQASIPLKFLKIDIGEVKERHLTIQAKRFFGNSFNTTIGYGRRTTTAKHAKDLLDLITSSYSQTASEIETDYIRLGLGNQWQWRKKYSLVVEWFTINIPIGAKIKTSADQYAKDQASIENIRDMEGILKWYPSGSMVQVGVGMMF